jgi:hypothetical protein
LPKSTAPTIQIDGLHNPRCPGKCGRIAPSDDSGGGVGMFKHLGQLDGEPDGPCRRGRHLLDAKRPRRLIDHFLDEVIIIIDDN